MGSLKNARDALPPRCTAVYYGPTKSGKTRIIGTYPGPILVIACGPERRTETTLRQMGRDDIHVLNVTSYDGKPEDGGVSLMQVLKNIAPLQKEMQFRTIAWDTMTLIYDLIVGYLTSYGQSSMNFQKWNMVLGWTRNMMGIIQPLGTHVVFTAHVGQDTTKDETQGIDQIIQLRPDIPGKSRKLLTTGADFVGMMEARNIIRPVPKDAPEGTKPESDIIYGVWLHCPPDVGTPFEAGTGHNAKLKVPFYKPEFGNLARKINAEEELMLIDTTGLPDGF